jgi:hypothetical protein
MTKKESAYDKRLKLLQRAKELGSLESGAQYLSDDDLERWVLEREEVVKKFKQIGGKVMKKLVATLAVMGLLVAGCGGTLCHPTKTAAEFSADKWDCENQAKIQAAMQYGPDPLANIGVVMMITKDCMIQKYGYTECQENQPQQISRQLQQVYKVDPKKDKCSSEADAKTYPGGFNIDQWKGHYDKCMERN